MAEYDKPLIHAIDSGGNKVAVTVAMLGGGGGGGGDASASNQLDQLAVEESIRNRLSSSDSDVIFTKLNELLTELQQKTEPGNTQTIAGQLISINTTFTRPADGNAYAALDVVGTSPASNLTFSNFARINGGSGYIVKARLLTNQSTCTARFRLHLYKISPTSIADNALFTLLFANAANRIGYIDFSACKTEGTGSNAASSLNDSCRLSFNCDTGSRDIFGILETLDAFTPASGQQFFIELSGDLN